MMAVVVAASVNGQIGQRVPVGTSRPIDSVYVGRSMIIDSVLRLLRYATSDSTYVLGVDANGLLRLRKISAGGGGIGVESDPIFVASTAAGISSPDVTNWGLAYDRYPVGLNFSAGTLTLMRRDGTIITTLLDGRYLQSYTETDPVFAASVASGIGTTDLTNWNQAFNKYPTGLGFTGGTLTLTRRDGSTVTVSLDGRYLQSETAFYASPASTILSSDLFNWNDAYNKTTTTASFNTTNGILTHTNRDGSTYTISLDGRYIRTADKGVNNGVATLDATGKIPSNQLSASYLTDIFSENSVDSMLASGAEKGDFCLRPDSGMTFVLQQIPCTVYANWRKLPTPSPLIISVNGQTGVVNLTTSDISEGSNLYYTDARVHAAVSAGTGLSYNSLTGVFSLPSVNSNVGTFGSATTVPQITYDAQGRATGITAVNISGTAPGGAAGGDLTGTYPNPTLSTSGVTAGTYGSSTVVPQITFDAKGRATTITTVTITGTAPGGSAGGDLAGSYPNPTLGTSGVTAATYGGAAAIPVITVDAKGRATAITTVAPTPTGSAGGDLTGTYPNPTLGTSGVTAGTYGSASVIPTYTVDAKGRITAVTTVNSAPPFSSITGKPTTVSGYGITDAVTPTGAATLANKNIHFRTLAATSYTTSVTPDWDSYDMYVDSAQSGALKLNNPTYTDDNWGDTRYFIVRGTGSTTIALTYDTQFSGGDVSLPTVTTASRWLILQFTRMKTNGGKWVITGKEDNITP